MRARILFIYFNPCLSLFRFRTVRCCSLHRFCGSLDNTNSTGEVRRQHFMGLCRQRHLACHHSLSVLLSVCGEQRHLAHTAEAETSNDLVLLESY